MIKSLNKNSDYNKRFKNSRDLKKMRDVKKEVNTLIEKGIQSTKI